MGNTTRLIFNYLIRAPAVVEWPSETATHPAQLPDARVGGLPETLSLYRRLAEEEKDFVVVWVFALGDPEGTNELWFWTHKVKNS